MRGLILRSIAIVMAFGAFFVYSAQANKESDEHHRKRAAARLIVGNEVVKSIYECKHNNGLWPRSLAELVPVHISGEGIEDWEFCWHPEGWWLLTDLRERGSGTVLSYEYRPDNKGWITTDGESRGKTALIQPTTAKSKLTTVQIESNWLRVVNKRIKATPRHIVHHQGLVCHFLLRKDLDKARSACVVCVETLPDHWWPHVMLALIDAQMGKEKEAERQLQQWVAKEPDFNRYFLLSHFYFSTKNDDKGFNALIQATKYRFSSLWGPRDDGEIAGVAPQYFPWIAVNLALHLKRFDVATAICDAWEKYHRQNSSADKCYLSIRAACYLAQRQFDQALATYDLHRRVSTTRMCTSEAFALLKRLLRIGTFRSNSSHERNSRLIP